ncbi:sensor histidine kinase [Ruicaihuangia caeni]|uniref:sensor histidine kinase n=1 Tax=Ruicaihuangia caeni TaxID=3042517 RepID=UPI00338E0768
MSLGLPQHLAMRSLSEAIAFASHVAAAVSLTIAALAPMLMQLSSPDLIIWPAAAATVPAIALLGLLVRSRSTAATLLFLIVGGAASFWYAVTLSSQLPQLGGNAAIYVLFIAALTCNAGPAKTFGVGVMWSTAGFVIGVASVFLGTAFTGVDEGVHPVSVMLFLFLLPALARAAFGGGRAESLRRHLYGALKHDRVDGIRLEAEREAAALLHDTVLGHLAALARMPDGPLDARLRTAIERDLRRLVGGEWLLEATTAELSIAIDTPFQDAVTRSRLDGLDVALTGDVHAIARLDETRGSALARAVEQCLSNVRRHSGTNRAEVAVLEGEGELTVVIVDAGTGFDPDSIADDRLGVRESILGRMERAGGAARIWSTPGHGTSVLLSLPLDDKPFAASASATARASANRSANASTRATVTATAATVCEDPA